MQGSTHYNTSLCFISKQVLTVCLSFSVLFYFYFSIVLKATFSWTMICSLNVFRWLKTPHFLVFLHLSGVFSCLLSPPVVSCLFSVCLYSCATVPPCGQYCNNNIVSFSFSSGFVLFPPQSPTRTEIPTGKGQIYKKKHVHHFLPKKKRKNQVSDQMHLNQKNHLYYFHTTHMN